MYAPPEHITELAYIYVTTTEQRPLLRLIAQLYTKNSGICTVEGTLSVINLAFKFSRSCNENAEITNFVNPRQLASVKHS